LSGLRIAHQCPQCGAPAELEETERLFACPFCRVRSFLLDRDYFRYLLPAKTRPREELVYYPYWRFKGDLLLVRPAGNDIKFVDVSWLAAAAPGLPPSLGVRPQALKLAYAAPDSPGRFVAPGESFAAAFAAIARRVLRALPGTVLLSAHLGEALGLIYAPLHARQERIYDAVLDRPISGAPVDSFPPAGAAAASPDWAVTFVPALCPECGWDLEGAREALVLICRNCAACWRTDGNRLARVAAVVHPSPEPGRVHLPFWQIFVRWEGIAIESYADLAAAAGLPRAVQPGWAERAFCFTTPAFKLAAQPFLRLAESLTLTLLPEPPAESPPPAPHLPVTIAADEAAQSLPVVLAGFLKPRERLAELIPTLRITPERFRLAYLPFRPDRHDYIHPEIPLAVNRSALRAA
jgi:DNA-directed RNA polymerase subunit RPC12/RpoP